MIGGLGKDTLYGNNDDDILIGGYTVYDYNLTALDAIMAEWSSNKSYNERVAYLSSGSGFAYQLRANATSAGARTIEDDEVTDTLYGEDGKDWFLANTDNDSGSSASVKDVISKTSGETVTDID
jgi:hypothetical protein